MGRGYPPSFFNRQVVNLTGLEVDSPRCKNSTGRGSVWLERSVRDAEVTGSSPVAPTCFDLNPKKGLRIKLVCLQIGFGMGR